MKFFKKAGSLSSAMAQEAETISTTNSTRPRWPIAERWREAARSIGVDIHNMASDAGHA